jgi:P-type conjugative transfer protein TrbG
MRAQATGAACVAALTIMLAGAQTALAQAPARPVPAITREPDGSLQYVFGSSTEPLITCQPLFVCDITLESGESVLNIAIGDSVRWVLASAQSGPGGTTPHILVKPTQQGLATNLVITTSKRTYYLRLASANFSSSSHISFSYPDDVAAAAQAQAAAEKQREEDKTTALPLLPPDQLDYNYRIVGAKEILPERVYNDGVHTFVEYAALPTDLPVVYGVAPDGSDQIVNFRLHGTTFIIDGIPSGVDLVLNGGTGKHDRGERRVSIRHK